MKRYNKTRASDVTLDTVLYEIPLFNPDPTVDGLDAPPIGADVDGIIDPSSSKYVNFDDILNVMVGNDWNWAEVDMTSDGPAYKNLLPGEKAMYDKAISALIFNDSAQTVNLAANMIPFISDGNIRIAMVRQAWDEAVHSKSYDVMLKDVSPNRDEIYQMYKSDPVLCERNQFLERMYGELAYEKAEGATVRKLLKAMIANNILEAIMFYAGFIVFWYLGQKMKGSASMISFIARDERTHVALFRNLFTATIKAFPRINKDEIRETAYSMVNDAVDLEIAWLKYLTGDNFPEFNDVTIGRYIKGKGDSILVGMGYEPLYSEPSSPLLSYEKMYDRPNRLRTNFFEGRPKTYTAKKLSTAKYFGAETN
jgi:ribonucleoside-diphosphate reductase beta chain